MTNKNTATLLVVVCSRWPHLLFFVLSAYLVVEDADGGGAVSPPPEPDTKSQAFFIKLNGNMKMNITSDTILSKNGEDDG